MHKFILIYIYNAQKLKTSFKYFFKAILLTPRERKRLACGLHLQTPLKKTLFKKHFQFTPLKTSVRSRYIGIKEKERESSQLTVHTSKPTVSQRPKAKKPELTSRTLTQWQKHLIIGGCLAGCVSTGSQKQGPESGFNPGILTGGVSTLLYIST